LTRSGTRIDTRIGFGLAVILTTFGVACGDDDATSDEPHRERVADALTRAVRFAGGVSHDGDLAALDPGAATVSLDPSQTVVDMSPGAASLMAFDLDNPTDDGVAATLLQFEGAGSHTAVPVGGGDAGADAGANAGGSLHVENPFEVADDVCEYLCNRQFTARLELAVELASGAVSAHRFVTITLDCRDDGDPDLCDGDEPLEDGGSEPDGGSSGASGGGGGGGGAGAGSGGSGAMDAGIVGDGGPGVGPGQNGPPPQLGLLTPLTATAGDAIDLMIDGSGFADTATIFVDGAALETTVVTPSLLRAQIPASATADAGSLYVYVENVAGDDSTRSNVLYVQLAPPPGAPIIYDYSPDNGLPGDTVLIIASNLAGQTLTIEDGDGNAIEPGVLGTISWPTAGSVDTVSIVLPDDIVSGPITVGNSLGSYRGKVFSVGMNLTRASGTLVESSTEYNTTNWGRASGADNLLATSFFTANGDCATLDTCTTVPWYQISFADAQTVTRIAMRGNREYASGYDFVRGTFELFGDGDDAIWEGTYDLPAPDRDLDIVLPTPVQGVTAVRFTSLEDESTEPGFAELEVFGR
jgi:hypothetical protein